MLSDTVRAISLLSASLVAFGMNLLAERIFRLKKTGLAFYILGCIFLPLALGGIGVFKLLGEWFSFAGDGAALLWTVIFVSITGSTFLGQQNYKNTVLVWLSLSGLAGTWASFSFFITAQLFRTIPVARFSFLGIMITVYAVFISIVYERYLRSHEESYITKAIPSSLYIILLMTAIFMFVIAPDARIAACVLSLVTAVLFCNYRFIERAIHAGIAGSLLCLMTSFYQFKYLFPAAPNIDPTQAKVDVFCFMFFMTSVLLMSLQDMPKLRTEFTKVYSKTGLVLMTPLFFYSAGMIISGWMSESSFPAGAIGLCYVLLILAAIFFAKTEKNAISEKTVFFVVNSVLLFLIVQQSIVEKSNLLSFGLVFSALLFFTRAILSKELWRLALAILTSFSVLILNAEHAYVLFFCLCAAGMLGGLIYANRMGRYLLERCCAWGFLAFLTPALQSTLSLFTAIKSSTIIWILTLAVCGLLYLLESFIFWKELRPNATKPYLEIESLLLSVFAVFGRFDDAYPSMKLDFLLCILLLIFAGGFLKKEKNAIAIPQLVMAFIVLTSMLENEESSAIKFTCYLVLLILYAGMGRILLPDGFYHQEENKQQILL